MHFMYTSVKRFHDMDDTVLETTAILPTASNQISGGLSVGRKKKSPPERFGERLRELRKAAGFTQSELATTVGTSQRMIAYYEAQGGNVSADVVAKLARALNVNIDDLVHGTNGKTSSSKQPPQDLRLLRKLRQVEKLPVKERKSVLQFIDVLVERDALKKAQA